MQHYNLVLVKTCGDVDLVVELQDCYPDWEVHVQGINAYIANYAREVGLDVVNAMGPA